MPAAYITYPCPGPTPFLHSTSSTCAMHQSTFFSSSKHLLSRSETQIELNHFHAQPSLRLPTGFNVDAFWNCPSLACNIAWPHTFYDPYTILPPPLNVPLLIIGRFDQANTPFPKRNIWEIQSEPVFPLVEGSLVFLQDFGIVSLKKSQSVLASHNIFTAYDEEGFTIVQLAIAKKEEPPAVVVVWKGVQAFLYGLCRRTSRQTHTCPIN